MTHTVFLVGTIIPHPQIGHTESSPSLSILGVFNTLQDAKNAVEANAMMLVNNDQQTLTIYKVPLQDVILYEFRKSDLKGSLQKIQKQQQVAQQTAQENAEKAHNTNEKTDS